MSTRSDRGKGVAGSSSSMHQRASSHDLWERKPYTIPLTFSVDKFKRNPKTAPQVTDVENRGLGYLMGPHSLIYAHVAAREFFKNLEKGYHGGTLTTTIDGRKMTFGPQEIAKALGIEFVASGPFTDDIMRMHPARLVKALHIGNSRGELKVRRAHLPRSLWFLDYVLRNLCPQRHKDERRRNFLCCLYSFHTGVPFNALWVMFLEF